MVEHALALTVRRIRNAYIYPASHRGNTSSPATLPLSGQRLRLRANFTIPGNWSVHERAVALGLQKYGAIVSDISSEFAVHVAADPRFPANAFANLPTILPTDFEVVPSTLLNEGPRSPGAPTSTVGPDQFVTLGQPATLSGTCTGTSIAVEWKLVRGPGTATLADATAVQTTAQFSAPGHYILRLSADDAIHAVAYDGLVVQVVPAVSVQPAGASTAVQFSSALGQEYLVQRCDDLALAPWTTLADHVPGTGAPVTVTDPGTAGVGQRFYRVEP